MNVLVKRLMMLLGTLVGAGVLLASPAQASDEASFLNAVSYLPSYTKPRPGYPDQVIAFGYQACRAMDHHPDDLEAAVAEAYPHGQARTGRPGEPNPDFNAHLFVEAAAAYLCPEHSSMWEYY